MTAQLASHQWSSASSLVVLRHLLEACKATGPPFLPALRCLAIFALCQPNPALKSGSHESVGHEAAGVCPLIRAKALAALAPIRIWAEEL